MEPAQGRIQNRLCVPTKPALLIKFSLEKKKKWTKNINDRFRTKEHTGNGVGFAIILKYSS